MILCDGFENGLGAGWAEASGSSGPSQGTIGLASDRVHSGRAALHAHVAFIGDGSGFGRQTHRLAVPKPEAWVRLFVYVTASSIPAVPYSSFELSHIYASSGYMSVGAGIAERRLISSGWGNGSIARVSEGVDFPVDRWVCLEYQLRQGATTSLSIWRDSQLAIDGAAVVLSEPVDAIFVGIYGANLAGVVQDVWIDDVAVGAVRPGCAPM
jgi:hypothetical protein